MGLFKRIDMDRLIAERDILGLQECLNESDPDIQIQAATALAKYGQPDGFKFLVGCLRNSKDLILCAAMEAMGELCDPRAVDYLIPFLRDARVEIRQTASEALTLIDTPEARQAMAEHPTILDEEEEEKAEPENEPTQDQSSVTSDPVLGGITYKHPAIDARTESEHRRMAREYFILADSHQEEGRTTQALTECEQVITLAPDWADPYNLKGILLEDLNKPYQALLAYQRAAKLDPNLAEAANNLSELVRDLEVMTTPLQDLIESTESGEWQVRCDAISALNQRSEPEALETIILQLEDEDPEVSATALDALEASQDKRAVEVLKNYYGDMANITGDISSPGDEQESFGSSIGSTSQMDVSYLKEPIQIPLMKSAGEFTDLADKAIEKDDFGRAEIAIQLALDLAPDSADAWNMLGIIRESREMYQQAKHAYRKALECDPGFREAGENLAELEDEYGSIRTDFPSLIIDIQGDDQELILNAIVDLGESGNPEAIEFIRPFVSSSDRKVALASAEALGKLKDIEFVPEISRLYLKLWDYSYWPDDFSAIELEGRYSELLTNLSDRFALLQIILGLNGTEVFLKYGQDETDRLSLFATRFKKIGIDDFSVILDLNSLFLQSSLQKYLSVNTLLDVTFAMQQNHAGYRGMDIVIASVLSDKVGKEQSSMDLAALQKIRNLPDLEIPSMSEGTPAPICLFSFEPIRRMAKGLLTRRGMTV
jgi:HEAT repeat protein